MSATEVFVLATVVIVALTLVFLVLRIKKRI